MAILFYYYRTNVEFFLICFGFSYEI